VSAQVHHPIFARFFTRLSAVMEKIGGLEVERVERFDLGPSWMVTNPHSLGAARRA
jgi:hypothetical protein